jgi:tetratricopeptide (TPR) repeat protein
MEFGALRLDQEQLPSALDHYENAIKLYGTTNDYLVAFCNENRAHILARLGRDTEAKQLLDDLFKEKDKYSGLVPDLHLNRAEMSLIRGDLPQAITAGNEAIKTGDPKSDVTVRAQYVLALAKADTGAQSEAQKLCDESIKTTSNAADFGLHSQALLACAEVALKRKDAQKALALATEAQERFARGSQLESHWRSWAIASRASKDLGDSNKAEEQLRSAQFIRSRLEQQLGSEAFKQYTTRPDIQVYYR